MRAHLLALGAIVAACIAAAAGVHDAVLLDLLFTLLLYAVLGQSWNWISGYAGNVSFGHAIFFACGAYAAALCVTHGLSPWLAFPAGALAAAALAAITGFPTLALRGHYFSIATIAVAALVDAFVRNVPGLGGANGFELPIASGWAALQFPAKGPYVLLALVLFAAAQLATILLERSRLGYYLRALRANHAAAASVGIGERRWKLIAFAWCATFAAAAGVLYAQYTLFVDPPSTLSLGVSIDIALIGVVGGIGTLWGPAVGALVYVALAKGVALELGGAGKGYDLVIYGAIICAIAALRPHGIVGTVVDALRRRRGALGAAAAATAACLLFVSAPAPLRAAGDAIDVAVAARAFADRSAECAVDGGRLWGVSLCGPMVFVDPRTREAVANQASPAMQTAPRDGVFVGTLPPDVGIANTAVTIGGDRWSMVMWPLPDDPIARRILVMHESWHRIQDRIGLPPQAADNAHLDTADGRYWLQMEWRALARAVIAPADRRAALVADALSFRAERVEKFPDAARNENALMLNEGLAEDTGVELTTVASDRAIRAVEELASGRRRTSFVRSFAYASGPAYGALLDSATPGWRRRLNAHSDLAAMLAAAYHVRPSAARALARAPAYDDGGLRIAENQRAAELATRLASIRARYVEGPVLRIPLRDANFQFDPNDVTPVPGQGSLYAPVTASGWFGSLDAPAGALMTNAPMTIVVPAPAPGASSGDGWTLSLAAGCRIVPGERAHDVTVACGSPAPATAATSRPTPAPRGARSASGATPAAGASPASGATPLPFPTVPASVALPPSVLASPTPAPSSSPKP
ncbi:MAG TPA: branched-chain amino acid ABC transporter permease [Candidatus Baltobacteraceae bacterium]|nr:branched-chain amino acid ABC transporter permease [Candidatus Baltobacteraceae bacterium]